PKFNEQDLKELPENVREEMEFIFVEHINEVLEACGLTKQERAAAS
ncbi:MAG TPA: S16 family serine protease, partial [Acidobacteriota bacterium]|nr:S16 family serine protease [Acidobacteriota bacterium]